MTGATAALTKPEVDRLARAFEAAYARGDMAAAAAFYTEDALIMPPDREAARGRPAIEQNFRALREQRGITALAIHSQEIVTAGEFAFDVGAVTELRSDSREGEASETALKYLAVWRRQADGMWRIAVDIFNRNAPA